MSQFDFGTIDPTTKSGTVLAADLNSFRNALNSCHSGTVRPAYAVAKTIWVNDAINPWTVYMYDGVDDIVLGTVNTITNVFTAIFAQASANDFAIGTRLTFIQAAAPTGWTIDATMNDKVIRIDSAAGGGTGGTWAISGLTTTIATHALTGPENGPHTHTVPGDGTAPAISSYASQTNTFNNNNITTSSSGSGTPHGHPGSTTTGDATWRPAHVNAIICTKN